VDLNIFFYAVIRRWFEMCNSANAYNLKYPVTEEELEYEGYPKYRGILSKDLLCQKPECQVEGLPQEMIRRLSVDLHHSASPASDPRDQRHACL